MYYVTITNSCDEQITVEISEEVFEVFEDSRKQEIRYDHERRDRIDKRGLDNIYVIREIYQRTKFLEEQYLHNVMLKQIVSAIESCTPLQKQRFYLYVIRGLTYETIATLQGCSKVAVHMSIKKVRERILRNI